MTDCVPDKFAADANFLAADFVYLPEFPGLSNKPAFKLAGTLLDTYQYRESHAKTIDSPPNFARNIP